MATGIGNDLDEAAKDYISKIASRRYSVGNMNPEDEMAYFNGQEEGIYHLEYELFDPQEQNVVRVKATNEKEQWQIQKV